MMWVIYIIFAVATVWGWVKFLLWALDSEAKIRRLHRARMLQLELDREYEQEKKGQEI